MEKEIIMKVEQIERNDLIQGRFLTIAGPCAIESARQFESIAYELAQMPQVHALRAMFRKPRTNPEDFQGLGLAILPVIKEVKRNTGLVIVSEILSEQDLEPTKGIVDVLQIGSRNMGNASLITACNKDGRPILLKRGMVATVKEWIGAARYAGLEKVIMCERGVRAGSEDKDIRFTLDLGGALVVKNTYGLPAIGDPSHPTGFDRRLVPPLAKAIAVTLDGIEIEVHNDPDNALCDAKQQITPAAFREVLNQIHAVRNSLYPYKEKILVA